MRALVEAGIVLASELSLEALLQRLVELAGELTGARYAALGVINADGTGLSSFVTSGIDQATRAEIGDLPQGRGILGLLIHDSQVLRMHDLREHPRSVGFPPGHPEMCSLLGVPIVLRGVAYGNLYLTEKEGGDFTEEDEEVAVTLAAQAAVSIENARLYESATRWLRQIETLNEVGNAMLEQFELPELLERISGRLRELLDARAVVIALPMSEHELRIQAADGVGAEAMVGARRNVLTTKMGRVFARRRSERVDSLLDDPEADRPSLVEIGDATGTLPRTALYAPLLARDRAVGIISVYDRVATDPRFSDADQRLAETFADRAAVAVDLSQRVARDTLRRIVEGQEFERTRLARELHDETGQALTSILLGLRSLESADGPEQLRERIAAVREQVRDALQNVRRLAVDLRPSSLDDFGVASALKRLARDVAERSGIKVDFLVSGSDRRLPREVESCLYRVVQEALNNVVKHADARHVSVLVGFGERQVSVVVEDDGSGFEHAEVASDRLGLVGMRERSALCGCELTIESARGRGTTLRIVAPVAG